MKKEWLVLFILFFSLSIVFYSSLSIVKSGESLEVNTGKVAFSPEEKRDFSLGFTEIIYSLIFSLFITAFLLWSKSITYKNVYLGTLIAIIFSSLIGFAFSQRYTGPYSTGFMFVAGLIVLVYIGKNFLIFRGLKNSRRF